MDISKKLIVALDFSSGEEALGWVRKLIPTVNYFKIGHQLFTREGPPMVREIQKAGGDIFLDLKFHDIPSTVFEATKSAMALEPFMINVHSLGGTEMMRAAREAVNQYASPRKKTLLIGVTVLTSLTDSSLLELKINAPVQDLVVHYAGLAKKAGLDGVVCSVSEVRAIKKGIGKDFITVTPGIRLEGKGVTKDDQKRIATVEKAFEQGADYVVLGRSLFNSKNPLKTLARIQRRDFSPRREGEERDREPY